MMPIAVTLAALAFAMAISSIPLAVLEIRVKRRLRTAARDRAFFRAALERPLPPPTKKLNRFIANNVIVTRFGDRRRRGGHTAELIAPQTEQISLPDEHVPVD